MEIRWLSHHTFSINFYCILPAIRPYMWERVQLWQTSIVQLSHIIIARPLFRFCLAEAIATNLVAIRSHRWLLTLISGKCDLCNEDLKVKSKKKSKPGPGFTWSLRLDVQPSHNCCATVGPVMPSIVPSKSVPPDHLWPWMVPWTKYDCDRWSPWTINSAIRRWSPLATNGPLLKTFLEGSNHHR